MISGQFIAVTISEFRYFIKRQTDFNYRNTSGMEKIDRTPFGKRLFDSREAADLTQDEAATKVGMAQSTLAEAEIFGKRSGYTSQLAELYGVSAKWLATGKPPKDLLPMTPAAVDIKTALKPQSPIPPEDQLIMDALLLHELSGDTRNAILAIINAQPLKADRKRGAQ